MFTSITFFTSLDAAAASQATITSGPSSRTLPGTR